jgi:hypothetical protein
MKHAALGVATAIALSLSPARGQVLVHPGALHTQADFKRMAAQVAQGAQPWLDGWTVLLKNRHASLNWTPHPAEIVYRGKDESHPENYALLYNDIAAAYTLAILDAWSATFSGIGGSSDRFLASGIYGYEFANAAEILRTSEHWPAQNFDRFKAMMLRVFYPMNHDFLARHNGAKIDHYWANWDLANMASMIAIGILADRRDIYDEAVEYFKHGQGNGAIEHVVWKIYPGGLGQTQESGRDQGHNTLNVSLLGAFCQMAWNQGDDLFGYDNNRVLKGVEYIAKYNLGNDVPYTPYVNSDTVQETISGDGRGNGRPVWELFYNHYVVLNGRSAPNISSFAQKLRPEGGGGNYGPNSGGYDQLGYGTLTYTLSKR